MERVAHVRTLAATRNVDAVQFAQALGRIGRTIFDSCGNAHLSRILREEAAGSLWGHLWREHTRGRRRSVAAASMLADAIIGRW